MKKPKRNSETSPSPTRPNVPVRVTLADSDLRGWFARKDSASLGAWREVYEHLEGAAKSENTQQAKQRDLNLFLAFLESKSHSLHVDDWTKPITTSFLRWLEVSLVGKGRVGKGRKRKATSINRIFSTLRHFAGWIQERRGFLAGDPCKGVNELVTDEPSWKGLSDDEVVALKGSAEQLLGLKTRHHQQPLRDKAVFLLLLHTGLRVSELLGLDCNQYVGKHLCDVKRKGKTRTGKVFLCKEAREALEAYLDGRKQEHSPLFTTGSGARMNRQDVDHLLKSLARQANVRRTGRPIQFSAHTLRHTFLRKVAHERGVEFAMQMSGHASSKYIWRYVKPSDEQTEAALENLF